MHQSKFIVGRIYQYKTYLIRVVRLNHRTDNLFFKYIKSNFPFSDDIHAVPLYLAQKALKPLREHTFLINLKQLRDENN